MNFGIQMENYQGVWKPKTPQQEEELKALEEALLQADSFHAFSKLIRTFPYYNQDEMERWEQMYMDVHPEEMIQLILTPEQKAHNQKILDYMDQNRGTMEEFFDLLEQVYPEREYPTPYQKTKE